MTKFIIWLLIVLGRYDCRPEPNGAFCPNVPSGYERDFSACDTPSPIYRINARFTWECEQDIGGGFHWIKRQKPY
jgi:hypothetical protein